MNSLDSMKDKLRTLGLYTLDGSTIIDAELSAYQAGLEPFYRNLEEAKREFFIGTSEGWGLARRENMIGPEKKDLEVQARRDILLSRFAITGSDFTREAIERAVVASGFEVSITERPSEGKIQINCIRILSNLTEQESMKEAAGEFLPAHLLWDFDFGTLLWDRVDEMDLTFEEMDSKDLCWEEIDSYRE